MDKAIVLVVEDEAFIRMNAVQMIEDAGYEALEAWNADEAIKILEARNDIQIVFTDINMPGSMDGLNLVQAIRNCWPSIKLIVTSGKVVLREVDILTDGRFLLKPYDARQVVNVLHELAA
jgi:CheY-like chemotaxis protein